MPGHGVQPYRLARRTQPRSSTIMPLHARYTSGMRRLVQDLCSDECTGRAPGTPGGRAARALVREALRGAGLDPFEQTIPGVGANILATLPGERDRWVLVAAHYDHLGCDGGQIYRGADDNAAAVAILVELARALAAHRPDGRGVIIAAFDAEEPPYFLGETMGSEYYARYPIVALERTDMMICMDLVGHALGRNDAPPAVRQSVFALGAERSAGTSARVDAMASAESGLIVRRAGADAIPPLSDYGAFWRRKIPFLFLSAGRSRRYHTPADTPEHLAWAKMESTARWVERFVRDTCARDEEIAFVETRDDRATLASLTAVLDELGPYSPAAAGALRMARGLLTACSGDGSLPERRRQEMQMLLAGVEQSLA